MQELVQKTEKRDRSALLDSLRGMTVISMVLFHAMWDIHSIFGMDGPWFGGMGIYFWQQITCCIFILLSGFCTAIGKNTIRRGGILIGIGAGITAVTSLLMPEDMIIFGVLTFLGSAMLIVGILKPLLIKVPAKGGAILSFLLFAFTKPINEGYLGIFSKGLIELPMGLYRNYISAYFGFPFEGFFSTDYFSLIPWIFLFLSGFCLYDILGKRILGIKWKGIGLLNLIGRHSLLIYVLHQPVIYGLLQMIHTVS